MPSYLYLLLCGPTRMIPVPFGYHPPSIYPTHHVGNSTIGYTLQTHPHIYTRVFNDENKQRYTCDVCVYLYIYCYCCNYLLRMQYCKLYGAETALDNTVRAESIAPQINIHIPFEFAANQSDC